MSAAASAFFYSECPVCHDNVPVHELDGSCCQLCRTEREVASFAAADAGDALMFHDGVGWRHLSGSTMRAEIMAADSKLAELRRGLLILFGILVAIFVAIGAVAVW